MLSGALSREARSNWRMSDMGRVATESHFSERLNSGAKRTFAPAHCEGLVLAVNGHPGRIG